MLWLWILGILAVLFLLLCLTRVGIRTAFDGSAVSLDVKAGPLRLRILPGKKKPGKAEKTKKEKNRKRPAKEKGAAAKPKLRPADIKEAVHTLWPPLKRALRRTRRGIRIHPMDLALTVGAGEDPAAGAELYGYLHAGVWTAMPALEQLIDIPDPHIHVGIDFEAPQTRVSGGLGISIRIGTVLAAALGAGIPALRWYLRFRKQKQPVRKQDTDAAEHAAA